MHRFAEVCDRISGTTKKLEKEQILSEYLKTLNDQDLAIACIFLTGSPFSMRDQRTTNVGFAAVRDALGEIAPVLIEQLGAVLLQTGDPGTAVQELLRQHRATESTPVLTLNEVLSYYEELTTSTTNRQKRSKMRDILVRATPLEAKYILKILLGGMRIGLQESLVESSIAKAFNHPLKSIQLTNMLLGDIGESAMLAKHNRLDEARMRLLHPLKLMLASPEEDLTKILDSMKGNGLAEDKYDGIRAQVHKENSVIRIYSRDLDDITGSFPDLVKRFYGIEGSVLLDGEIVPFKNEKILGFAELQKRLGRKVLTDEMLEMVPCRYFAFDLIFENGELLISERLADRKKRLVALQENFPEAFSLGIYRNVHTPDEIEEAFAASRNRNNEGLVIKHPDSPYTPGKRGKSWLKLKRAEFTLDVVVTVAEYGHGKRAGLLSDYTFAVQHEGKLLNIGKAYSGITDQELYQLSDLFHQISIRNEGYYHVVPPRVVFEVTFDRINRSSRHESGFALRFPRIKRIRWDKTPEEIDTLETVESLYNSNFASA
jgi:DNA ligase-1